MKATFLKGVVLGAIVSSVTLVTSMAFAGTGIGSVFNLGQSNRVNAITELTGTNNGPGLRVSNSNAGAKATGIGIPTAPGVPPLRVNSTTKVDKFNADMVDGLDSSAFQRATGASCANGTAMSALSPNGGFSCTGSAVLSFVSNPVNPLPYQFQNYLPSTLRLFTACHDPGTEVSFINNGSAAVTLNWMFSQGGTTSTVNASGTSIAAGGIVNFNFANRIEGQFIYAEAAHIVTVNLHAFDGGVDACEFRGTVEIAPA
jgi:hypothetical protein